MGSAALLLLLAGAILVGWSARRVGRRHFPHEPAVTAVAAGLGAYFASGLVSGTARPGPIFDGLILLPALVGAIVVAGIVDGLGRGAALGGR